MFNPCKFKILNMFCLWRPHKKSRFLSLVCSGGLSGKLLACRPSQPYGVVYSTEALFTFSELFSVFLFLNH